MKKEEEEECHDNLLNLNATERTTLQEQLNSVDSAQGNNSMQLEGLISQ